VPFVFFFALFVVIFAQSIVMPMEWAAGAVKNLAGD
jgi:hypothetical protein